MKFYPNLDTLVVLELSDICMMCNEKPPKYIVIVEDAIDTNARASMVVCDDCLPEGLQVTTTTRRQPILPNDPETS